MFPLEVTVWKQYRLAFVQRQTFEFWLFFFICFSFFFLFSQYGRFHIRGGVKVGTFPNQSDVSMSDIWPMSTEIQTFLFWAPEICMSVRIEEHLVEKQVELQFPRQRWNFQISFSFQTLARKNDFREKEFKKKKETLIVCKCTDWKLGNSACSG